MNKKAFGMIGFTFVIALNLYGCFEGPSSSSNSSTNGEITGIWKLNIVGTGAFDEMYQITFEKEGNFQKVDSSCFVGSSVLDNKCQIKYRWSGVFKKNGNDLIMYRIPNDSDVAISGNTIKDTMQYSILRLDDEALVIAYKLASGTSDSIIERYYRSK